MKKEEIAEKIKEDGLNTFSWIISLGIFFLVIAALSPILLIWATFGMFIKVLLSAIFLFVVTALAWKLIKKLVGEISEEEVEKVIKNRKNFQDKMKEKLNANDSLN